MTSTAIHNPEVHQAAELAQISCARQHLTQRCRHFGITLLWTDGQGAISPLHAANLLEDAIVRSTVFAIDLSSQVRQWSDRGQAHRVELWPGSWVVPLPVRRRRRHIGWHVALLLGRELADCEQFHLVCDELKLDRSSMLGQAGPSLRDTAEVARIAEVLAWVAKDVEQLQRQQDEVDGLSRQLSEAYEELNVAYTLASRMTVTQRPEQFIAEACSEVQQVLGLRWLALQLTDDDERLEELRGRLLVFGPDAEESEAMRKLGQRLLRRAADHPHVQITGDLADLAADGAIGSAAEMLIVPVVRGDRPVGVLFATEREDEAELSSVDGKLVGSLAHNFCIFLDNAMLYEDLHSMFMGALQALVNAIDAKDTYTCGHSERVAWATRQLAEAAGLDPQTVERVYLAGIVHDVGKIGIPEAVLCKPGRLTVEEFDLIKAHPEIGARILRDIRQMDDLIPGVLHHHERWDGKGYPDGLAGHDIPLFGRLICLADSFDAMSSDRTYRGALPMDEALAEIEHCAGLQFDPELAAVFQNIDFQPYQQMVRQHEQRSSPLEQLTGRAS